MSRLEKERALFMVLGLVGVLALASPTLSLIVHVPVGEEFSVLYVLGSSRTAQTYPFNVSSGQDYVVFLGVTNHLGSSAYYTCYVKLTNETDLLPNDTAGTPSPAEPLYEIHLLLQDGETREKAVLFSFDNVTSTQNETSIVRMSINGVAFNTHKPALWDSDYNGYYYRFLVELWVYNVQSQAMEFNSRFVDFPMNMTQTA
jgi:hypothetical protein